MKHIRAISLDLDDTLWAIEPVIARAEIELIGLLGEQYPRVIERFDAAGLREVRNQVNTERPDIAHDLSELRRVSFERVLEECGYEGGESHRLLEHFIELRHRVELYPDVEPALEFLAARYHLVAVSNGNAEIDRIGDIGRYFAGAVSARGVGVGKPDPRVFQAACEIVGCAPAAVLHVGDDPTDDILGASRHGMATAWINRSACEWIDEHRPDLTIGDLTELIEHLVSATDRVDA